jgi:hypothetical protein
MTLYHFTGSDHAEKIKREGITKGGVYIPPHSVKWGYIWLTDDPRFNAQHWATNHSGAYGDRTEVRFTIELDGAFVMPWNIAARKIFGMCKRDLIEFNLAGGSDGAHWYLCPFAIPVAMIKAIDKRLVI